MLKENYKNKLIAIGVDVSSIDAYFPIMMKKGIWRYIRIAEGIVITRDKHSIKLSNFDIEMIHTIYVFDLLVRRELFRILVPIEINIKSALLNEFDAIAHKKPDEAIRMLRDESEQKIIDSSYNEEVKKKIIDELYSHAEYLNNKIDELKNTKKEFKNLFEYIDSIELEYLRKVIILSKYLDNFNFNKWFDGTFNNLDLSKNFTNFQIIRNTVMHHNIFFSNSSKRISAHKIVSSFLEFEKGIFGDNSKARKSFFNNISLAIARHLTSENKLDFKKYQEVIKNIYGLDFFNN